MLDGLTPLLPPAWLSGLLRLTRVRAAGWLCVWCVLWQVLEYMEGGSLEQLMRDKGGHWRDFDAFQAITHNVLKVGGRGEVVTAREEL